MYVLLIPHMRQSNAPKISGQGHLYSKIYRFTIKYYYIDHVRRSEAQQEYYTVLLSLGFINCNIDDVSG